MSDQKDVLTSSQSCHHTSVSAKSKADAWSKSELDCSLSMTSGATSVPCGSRAQQTSLPYDAHYYKKYEHDELPVKDSDNVFPARYSSLTNSDLDVIERRIYKNVSQELQTDDVSLGSLESNIKFFKITVEKIFDNFYTSMSDFEHYKKRFHEILDKSKEGSIEDMEDFIRDMFDHIMSSDNLLAKISRHSAELVTEIEDKSHVNSCGDSSAARASSKDFLEAFKNEQYYSDSADEQSARLKKLSDLEEKFNVFFLGCNPYVEINLVGRSMVSEMNVKRPGQAAQAAASADNLSHVAAKRRELERHNTRHDEPSLAADRDIPVKVSSAKKNIHLDEDFAHITDNDASKSFLSKFCSLLCRKFRRST